MVIDFCNFSPDDTRDINQIADEIKKEYTEFIDDCCKQYNDNYLFWATPLASRNIFNDNTFLRLCRIIHTIRLINKGGVTRVITEDNSERDTLKGIVKDDIRIDSHEKLISRLRSYENQLRYTFKYIGNQIDYIRYAPKQQFNFSTKISVVIAFAVSSHFDGYYYHDKYTTNIEKYDDDVVFFPEIVNNETKPYSQLLDKIKNCENKKYLYDKTLSKYTDLIEIFRYRLFVNIIKNNKHSFKSMDISPIIKRGLQDGRCSGPAYEGLIMRKRLQRLSKKNIRIKNFILWYEGRPIDILNSTTIRECFPKAGCVGYEGTPLPEILLSEYVTDYQYRSEHAPKTIAVPGQAYEPDAHQFCHDIPLIFCPVLRNDYVLHIPDRRENSEFKILVLLSYFVDVSHELIEYVNDYVKKGSSNCRIALKNHPTKNGLKADSYGFDQLCFEPDYVEGQLNDILAGYDAVITSITSANLEIVCAGIPLIVLFPRGKIGYTALPSPIRDDFCEVVFDSEDMSNALNRSKYAEIQDYSTFEGLLATKTEESIKQLFEVRE